MLSSPGPEIGHLRARLVGGVLPAVRRIRPVGTDHDEVALDRRELWRELEPLDAGVAGGSGMRAARVDTALAQVTEVMRKDRQVLLAVLFSPFHLVQRITAELDDDGATDRVWVWLCWLAEASWRVVTRPDLPDTTYAPGDQALLAPVAARLRFLVLTEPLRYGIERWPTDPDLADHDLPEVAFGDNTAHEFIARCRQARWHWQRCLNEYQSHPLLAAARPEDIEQELDQLTFRCPRRGWRGRWRLGRPMVVSWTVRDDPRPPVAADDAAAVADVVERHLLPRFRLTRVARLAASAPVTAGEVHRRGGAVAAASVGAATVVLAAFVALALAGLSRFTAATWAATAAFVLLGLQVVVFGRLWATQWLLRLPAAGAVGLVVLVALAPTWWQSPVLSWHAPAVLVGASFGYLMVEARNHGVGSLAAPGRAAAVVVVGCVQALLVALVGLVAVAPSYAENSFAPPEGGHTLAALWRHPELAGQALRVLALAGAWCLAVGVFSQILWDDRPISAPLAHLRWRREDTT